MFGREFISIILRNLSSIQPALRDVNRNSGRNPYPKNSVKNYMSYKISRCWGRLVMVFQAARKRVRNDYGAGGGNFIGVCAGVDVDSGVGDACGDSDGDSIAVGAGEGATVADTCGDDIGDACDALLSIILSDEA
jgi:hypothetical protein